jgi:hypothetical protein
VVAATAECIPRGATVQDHSTSLPPGRHASRRSSIHLATTLLGIGGAAKEAKLKSERRVRFTLPGNYKGARGVESDLALLSFWGRLEQWAQRTHARFLQVRLSPNASSTFTPSPKRTKDAGFSERPTKHQEGWRGALPVILRSGSRGAEAYARLSPREGVDWAGGCVRRPAGSTGHHPHPLLAAAPLPHLRTRRRCVCWATAGSSSRSPCDSRCCTPSTTSSPAPCMLWL